MRNTIGYVRGFGTKIQEFATAFEHFDLPPKTLPTNISTRWNTTYLILEVCLPYKKVVNFIYNSSMGTPGVLTEVD